MPRAPTPDALRARAVAAVIQHGLSLRAAADQIGVTATTVKRWVDEERDHLAKAPPAPPVPAPATPPPELPPRVEAGPTEPLDVIAEIRGIMAMVKAVLPQAKEVGNMSAITTAIGHLSRLAPVLARLEKKQNEDRDVIRLSRADVAARMQSIREKVNALTSRDLLCAKCGRELSADWGGLAKDAQARLFDQLEKQPDPKQV